MADPAWAGMQGKAVRRLWAIFSAELILFAIIRLPLSMSLDAYAFADRGVFLTACYLVAHGKRPTIDFGYLYGLLPILATQRLFHLFGWAPIANEAAMLVCGMSSAYGMARFAGAMRLRRSSLVLLVVAFPLAILASYPTFVHAMEAAVLCNALAEQAAGRRASALALATAACAVKPAMGYVYGFVLVVLILADVLSTGASWGNRLRTVSRSLAPAAVTATVLLVVLAALYGTGPLIKTLIPGAASVEYRRMGYGSIFSGGRYLWYQPHEFPGFYLFTIAGFWITATVWIALGGVWAAIRLVGEYRNKRIPCTGLEMVFTCAVLHLLFITCFFGGPVSWEYYSYVLVMGVVASGTWNASRTILSALTVLALSGQMSHLTMAFNAWRTTDSTRTTAWLWASTDERRVWRRVLHQTSGNHAVAVISEGAVSVIFKQFEPPFGAFVTPGVTLKPELAHVATLIEQAPMIFAITSGPLGYALDFFPQFRRALNRRPVILNLVTTSGTFTVYGAPKPSGNPCSRPGPPTRAP